MRTSLLLAVEKSKTTFLAPVSIGLALFIAEMSCKSLQPHSSSSHIGCFLTYSAVYYTGGSLNPARTFGPCVVEGKFAGSHWIYWLGPILGSLLAVAFYSLLKFLEFSTANPGQDFDDLEDELFQPASDEHAATAEDVRRPNVAAAAAAGTSLAPMSSMDP
jgi:aquaporin related protein